MKKEKNNGSAKRLIIIVSLCLALLVLLGAFSFAWIRNYVDVDDLEITTGKMLYNFKLYRVNNGVVEPLTFFDTNDPDDSASGESEIKVEKNIDNAVINIEGGEEVFFVIEKYDDSIDFDVALSFDKDGFAEYDYDYIGQIRYAMADDTTSLSGVDTQTALESYLKAPGENPAGDGENLGNIWNTVQKASLAGEQKYACIRLKLEKSDSVSAGFDGSSLPFRIGFAVAQAGALPDDMQVDKFYVDDVTTLENAMQNYGFGDEIYITQDVNYTGDLVFTRPCTVTLIRSTLTLKGNLLFSYMYGGKFTLNTVSDGHIKVEKNNGSGGNFRIDLPDTTIELAGANNDAAGKADIYVEGSFTANASKNEGEGLLFRGARICNIEVDSDVYTYSTELKPIVINGAARVSVSNRTRLGKLSVNFYCNKLVVENNGYIEKIDLTGMTQDVTLLSTPAILIDNAGTVGTVDRAQDAIPDKNDGDVILLPEWSRKFNENDKSSADDNTHIIANKGSGKILAITPNNNFDESVAIIANGKFFFSVGDKGETYRDDIDYMLRTQFVETVDGDKTKIIIHYEAPADIVLKEDQYSDLSALNGLDSYVAYYATKGEIASASELTDVKIICYGNKALSEADYTFLKEMTALTTLDLADAVSVNKAVPDNAFNGMSALTSVKMSESDTMWGKFIFTGTGVDEITFPQSLTKLDNPKNNSGTRVTSQKVLDGIKYVYTSIDTVEGFYLDPSVTQYLFTPDQYSYEKYRALYSNIYWNSKIFLNNGVIRYGEYFLRYDPDTTEINPTCEFVVFTGGSYLNEKGIEVRVPWVEDEYNNCGFNFQRININGKVYTITSFDPYAFFDKLVCEENLEIVISDSVKLIGERAFACGPNMNATIGLESVTVEGDPEINGYAFTHNDTLVSFNAPELTSLKGGQNFSNNKVLKTFYAPKLGVVEGAGDLSNCPELERVDISVVERTDINKNFYTSNDSYSYAKFYIHTENAKDISAYKAALAADYRYIFVKESYAKLYRSISTYTGVTDIGENELDAIIEADVDGNDIVEGKQLAYYYVVDGNNANLVACLLPEIDVAGEDYITIASFNHNGVEYPVTYIGSAAYHFTSIIAQNVKICNGVEELGDHVFNSEKEAFKKYCITLDLNNVVKAGKGAFFYMDMVRIVGDKFEEVGKDTLSYNQNLIVANLPNLSRSRPAGSTEAVSKVFEGALNLRLTYVGFSKDIAYDDAMSRTKSYIRFINYAGGAGTITIPKVNTVVNSALPAVPVTFLSNFVQVDKNFNGIYLSDYYEYKRTLMGLSYTIELPGYVYYKQENGELSLIAVSPDIKEFGDFQTNSDGGNDYLSPGNLYKDGEGYTAKDNGTSPEFTVTLYGNYAYGAVSMVGVDNFKVADTVKKLDYGALRGSAYVSDGVSNVMLEGVNCLDLANVSEIGNYVCYDANIEELKALSLKYIGDMAFTYCRFLEEIYLPSYVSASGTHTFRYCYSLKSATFGKNTELLANNVFEGDEKLEKITILNPNSMVTIGSALLSKAHGENVLVSVPAAIYNEYVSTYADSYFGNIPVENFRYFGASTEVSGLTYYWNVLSESDKTAYIDYVEGSLPTTLTLPTTLDGYTVVSVSAETMSALSGVTEVILPDGMEYLNFTAADIADTVATLKIADANTKFKTVNGVLYTEDGKTLLVYPMAKGETVFTVENSTTEIAYRAFYGTKNLKTLIINNSVTVRDQAFEASGISILKFTNATASIFAGRDIFLDANTSLSIRVPGASVSAYKANVLVDYSIVDKIVGA